MPQWESAQRGEAQGTINQGTKSSYKFSTQREPRRYLATVSQRNERIRNDEKLLDVLWGTRGEGYQEKAWEGSLSGSGIPDTASFARLRRSESNALRNRKRLLILLQGGEGSANRARPLPKGK